MRAVGILAVSASVDPLRLLAIGPLTNVATTLDNLGVTGKKWRADILGQIDKMLNSPSGHVWLKDVLVGPQGHGGVISVPNSGIALEDVVDIRVTARPSTRTHTDPPARQTEVPGCPSVLTHPGGGLS